MNGRDCSSCNHKGGGKRNPKTRGLCTYKQFTTEIIPGFKAQMLETLWYARTDAGNCGPNGKHWETIK